MEITKQIRESVKDTVGYAEASNKESFMIGSSVAFKKSEVFYEGAIKSLTAQLNQYKSAYETVLADINLITSTIHKYQPQD